MGSRTAPREDEPFQELEQGRRANAVLLPFQGALFE